MTPLEQDDILLKAALEFGQDHLYDIRMGTLGPTLFIHVEKKEESSVIRKLVPMEYEGLRTIVTYTNNKFEGY